MEPLELSATAAGSAQGCTRAGRPTAWPLPAEPDGLTDGPATALLDVYPTDLQAYVHTNTHMRVFTAAPVTVAPH